MKWNKDISPETREGIKSTIGHFPSKNLKKTKHGIDLRQNNTELIPRGRHQNGYKVIFAFIQ